MSHYNQQQQINQPTSTAATGPYVTAPPAGYPMSKDGLKDYPQYPTVPVETKSKGDGFLRGCCAALCCCCLLDACF